MVSFIKKFNFDLGSNTVGSSISAQFPSLVLILFLYIWVGIWADLAYKRFNPSFHTYIFFFCLAKNR